MSDTAVQAAKLTRRQLLCLASGVFPATLLGACMPARSMMEGTESLSDKQKDNDGKATAEGRLTARPRPVNDTTAPRGLQPLRLDDARGALLYVPPRYQATRPAPLVLMLHGAGSDAPNALSLLRNIADEAGFLLLAPTSRRSTWDIIIDRYGPDLTFINRALEQTFARYSVDTGRIAIGGFSDGASYALSLGVSNGDLFTHVIAFSPGFMSPAAERGKPRLFISHGTRDKVLPIERCSRRIVAQVERAGYDVRYREFEGAHTVPAEIAREAVKWFDV